MTFSPKVFVPLTNLCRDFCGYCTFRKAPGEPGAKTMTLDEVLRVVRQGKAMGCTEVLLSLGDKPEAIYPEMKQFLTDHGHQRTLDYLHEACRVVLEETGLLPHANAGVMGRGDLQRLKEVNPSMGLMLESVSERLMLAGAAHDNAPDKKPAVRLRTLELAGELRIPFTTGILIGIGEDWPERIDSLLAIRELHERYGHIQEVIVQNFRAKPTIPMRAHPDATQDDMIKTIALARLILGGAMNIQAPPNLTPDGYELYLGRRHQRLGRRVAADARLHQSRGALAGAALAPRKKRPGGIRVKGAAADLSRVYSPGRQISAGDVCGRSSSRCAMPTATLKTVARSAILQHSTTPLLHLCLGLPDAGRSHRRHRRRQIDRRLGRGNRSS